MSVAEFKNKAVRDLAWAVSTPPLVSYASCQCHWPTSIWYQAHYKEMLPWFVKLDQDCSELDTLLLEQKDKRLGRYFETLWFYWLSHHPRYEIVAHNLQIIIDGETLGEMDFILFDKKNKQIVHWEVAVKFYLGANDTRQMNNWYGPNLRDRLDIKVKHLLKKQSIISKDQRVAEWLRKQGFVIERCAVILKGRLYYPLQQLEKFNITKVSENLPVEILQSISPTEVPVDHSHGQWIRESEFDRLFDQRYHFLPLINKGWLAEWPTTDGIGEVFSKQRIVKTLSNETFRLPLHLQLYQCDEAEARFFIVDGNWPKKMPK